MNFDQNISRIFTYPFLLRRLSFGYTEYMLASQQGRFPAAANFLTAVVHAAAGHKFNELKLLVDVAQAFRQLQAGDIACLEKILDVIPARLEVLTCLDLICVLFENLVVDDVIAQLAGQIQFRVARKLVTTDAVLNTYFDRWHVSRLRRHSFRFLQNRLGR